MSKHTPEAGRIPSREAIELEVEAEGREWTHRLQERLQQLRQTHGAVFPFGRPTAASSTTSTPAGARPTPVNPAWNGTNSSWAWATARNRRRKQNCFGHHAERRNYREPSPSGPIGSGAVESARCQRPGKSGRMKAANTATPSRKPAATTTGSNSGPPLPSRGEKLRPQQISHRRRTVIRHLPSGSGGISLCQR